MRIPQESLQPRIMNFIKFLQFPKSSKEDNKLILLRKLPQSINFYSLIDKSIFICNLLQNERLGFAFTLKFLVGFSSKKGRKREKYELLKSFIKKVSCVDIKYEMGEPMHLSYIFFTNSHAA